MPNKYQIALEVDPKFQYGPEALNGIYVRSSTGQQMAPTARQQTPATLKSP